MPSKNLKQHSFMEMIAHSPKKAKKAGVPQSVGKDFVAADKGKTFKGGGKVADLKKLFKGKDSKAEELKEAKAIKSGKITPEQYAKGEDMEKVKGKGKPYKKGGSIKEARLMPAKMENVPQGNKPFGEHVGQKKGHTKGKNLGDSGKPVGIQVEKRFKSGGCATRGDGIAQKGKTKGKVV